MEQKYIYIVNADYCVIDGDYVKSADGYPVAFQELKDAETKMNEARSLPAECGLEIDIFIRKLEVNPEDVEGMDDDEMNEYYTHQQPNYGEGDIVAEDIVDGNEYKSLKGGVVLAWEWDRYIGSARNYGEVCWGEDVSVYNGVRYIPAHTERDILSDAHEHTLCMGYELIITADELEGKSDEDKRDYIVNIIMSDSWRWNYRKGPDANEIVRTLRLCPYPEIEES